MKTELANDFASERYVVEIDGIATAEYCVFVKALRASLRLQTRISEKERQTARSLTIIPICLPIDVELHVDHAIETTDFALERSRGFQ